MLESVESKARRLLLEPDRHPGLIARNEHQRKLLIWCFPSFQPYSSWALYHEKQRNKDEAFYVRRLQWDGMFELPRSTDEPTVFGGDSRIADETAHSLIAGMQSVKFEALCTVPLTGCDGTTCGISTGSSPNTAVLQWWSVAPQEWTPLRAWFDLAVAAFEAALPESVCEGRRAQR